MPVIRQTVFARQQWGKPKHQSMIAGTCCGDKTTSIEVFSGLRFRGRHRASLTLYFSHAKESLVNDAAQLCSFTSQELGKSIFQMGSGRTCRAAAGSTQEAPT